MADIRNSKAHPLVAFIAFYISQRNEDTATTEHFTARFETMTNSLKLPNVLKNYLLFRIANRYPEDLTELVEIIRYESTSAIIDYYDTFIRIGEEIVLRQENPLKRRFIAELKSMFGQLHQAQ